MSQSHNFNNNYSGVSMNNSNMSMGRPQQGTPNCYQPGYGQNNQQGFGQNNSNPRQKQQYPQQPQMRQQPQYEIPENW